MYGQGQLQTHTMRLIEAVYAGEATKTANYMEVLLVPLKAFPPTIYARDDTIQQPFWPRANQTLWATALFSELTGGERILRRQDVRNEGSDSHEAEPAISYQLARTFADRLPDFYVACDPMMIQAPQMLQFNAALANELGLHFEKSDSDRLARVFAGQDMMPGAYPVAQAYAGHQFGGFVPQLGDGRALLLGEVIDRDGNRRDIALKGSGPTPFSRGGDGKAAVAPVLREYLIGEAMHALGIPTTRALGAVSTGEVVMRMQPLPGAILTRVAASHLRVGTFEYFASRRRYDDVRDLAEYVIERHYPELADEDHRFLMLLQAVADRQAQLVAKWMSVGFIHGVMNTDNMTISGETIDYGPCAFMEAYDSAAVFSSIDVHGRYAYCNQPKIARWNLARFAETILPLMHYDEPQQAVEAATEVVDGFVSTYERLWLSGVRSKLGLSPETNTAADDTLARDWLELLQRNAVDYTLAFRRLADAADGKPETLESLFPSADVIRSWLGRWQSRLTQQPASQIAVNMRAVNPIYIPRNHLVEEALEAASNQNNMTLFERLLQVVTRPFEERTGDEDYAEPASRKFTACYKTFCGT